MFWKTKKRIELLEAQVESLLNTCLALEKAVSRIETQLSAARPVPQEEKKPKKPITQNEFKPKHTFHPNEDYQG